MIIAFSLQTSKLLMLGSLPGPKGYTEGLAVNPQKRLLKMCRQKVKISIATSEAARQLLELAGKGE